MQHRDPNTKDEQYIQPTELGFGSQQESIGAAQAPSSPERSQQQSQRRQKAIQSAIAIGMLSAFVGVFWGLPQLVEKPRKTASSATGSAVTAGPIGAATQSGANDSSAAALLKESPYTEAEIVQQRRDVQKVLQDILQLQEELTERKVEVWAAEEYFAARSIAEEADTVYRQRKFMLALEQYRAALAGLQQLRDSVPERIETHLAAVHAALDSGDAKSAHKELDLLLTISPEHPRGVAAKARAEKLPEVWALFTSARDAFAANELDNAKSGLEQALAIDGDTRPARELLPKVTAAILERDYSEAMSAGYAAIAANNFQQAKSLFAKAQLLKPEANDPKAGIQQADNGLAQARIDRLFAQAATFEQNENWHKAAESYATLVGIDSSLVSAHTGKARSEARAKLDDQLQGLLKDPLTLSQGKRNQYARNVLADARELQAATPRISGQIEQLETALTQSLIPITVRLQSDASTDVTIYHVGKLGNFSEREIALKPGRYTVVGTRQGYRDVRQEIVVDPGGETPVVTIQCAEKIIGANNS